MNRRQFIFTLLSACVIIFNIHISYHFFFTDDDTNRARIKTDKVIENEEFIIGASNAESEKQNLRMDKICKCRKIEDYPDYAIKSLCGDSATARGPEQKVLSFSLYGRPWRPVYYEVLAHTLFYMPMYYPGYTMRIYHEFGDPNDELHKTLCYAFCQNPSLDLCDVNEIKIENVRDLPKTFGMTWRFIPMADELVDEWHSRDMDSLIGQREIDAVQDWRESGRTFHIMRDHFDHGSLFVGCMFGMKVPDSYRQKFKEVLVTMLEGSYNGKKGKDQDLLNRHLYSIAEPDSVIHDSYFCQRYKSNNTRPWPTKRVDPETPGYKCNFATCNGHWVDRPCPVACRPKDHQDWTYC